MNIFRSAADTKPGCATNLTTMSSRRTSPTSTRRWRTARSSSCAPRTGAGPRRSTASARDLKDAPQVLAVGDIHVENFGTWRDAEGRLVWGVNDFDEAARMPYVLDIVRLAASAVLAKVPGITPHGDLRQHSAGLCEQGLKAPAPFVLDHDHKWLRKCRRGERQGPQEILGQVRSRRRSPRRSRKKVDPVAPRANCAAATARRIETRAARCAASALAFYARDRRHRQSRAAAVFRRRPWQGDLIVREAKAMARSGWSLAHGGAHRLRCAEIATGRYRSPDPTYHLRGQRAGAAAVAERLQDRGRAAEEDKAKRKPKDGKDQHAAGAAADQCSGCCTRWATSSRRSTAARRGEGRYRGRSRRRAPTAGCSRRLRRQARSGDRGRTAASGRNIRKGKKADEPPMTGADRTDQQNALLRRRRMRQLFGKHQEKTPMPRPSVARQAPHIPQAARIRLLGDSQSVGRRLGALPAGPRLQGAGLDIVGLRMVGGACRQCGRRRHGAGASERDRRRDRRAGECRLRGRLRGRSGGRRQERHALLRDRRRGAVDRGLRPATRTSRSTTFRSRSSA